MEIKDLKTNKKEIAIESSEEACCIPTLVEPALNTRQARKAADLFNALADPTRLTILSLIARNERREACVCDLTASFNMGQPSISHHLKILKDAELIQGDKRGKWVYYSLVAGRSEEIKELLDTVLKIPVGV
jgi:ArsR family transcriptional regulator